MTDAPLVFHNRFAACYRAGKSAEALAADAAAFHAAVKAPR
jgi:hypothetical protein